jgi:hypothetical protein
LASPRRRHGHRQRQRRASRPASLRRSAITR